LKILEQDPDAKILVYCGFGHVIEDGHPSWGRAMAGILGELSNTDRFTIDQVVCSERSHENYESPLYKNVVIDRSAVFVDNSGQPLNYRPDSAYIDINVFHPRTRMISDRPDWLLRSNTWKEYKLDEGLNLTFPCIVAAFYPDENATDAVPIDVIQIDASRQKSL